MMKQGSPLPGAGVFGGAVLAVAVVFTTVAGDAREPAAAETHSRGTQPGAFVDGYLTAQAAEDVRAREIIGMPVSGRDGSQIGEIRDLVFDRHNRLIGFVLATGGILGINTRAVAVPPTALRFEGAPGRRHAYIAMTESELAQAPEFQAMGSGVVLGLLGLTGTPARTSR